MNIDPTGEYIASENGTYFGTFKLADDGKYSYLTSTRYYTAIELTAILSKLEELNL